MSIPKQHYKVHGATTAGKGKCISCLKELPDGLLKIDITSNVNGKIQRGYHCPLCVGELDNHLTLA